MKQAFITVDVECHDIALENLYIWGRNTQEDSGIKKILEMGKKLDIPINFFLDFPEAKRYGDQYIKAIVDEIQSYRQPIFLHLHPNYITGDDTRSFLWEYTEDEQRNIFKEGHELYLQYMKKEPLAFRAGRYGMNDVSYKVFKEIMPDTVDFSYLKENGKMCHLTSNDYGAVNVAREYKNVKCVPNSTFLSIDIFRVKKRITVDASQIRYPELKAFLRSANGNDFTLTMHSWHFIDKVFWNHKRARVNRNYEKRFEKYVKYIQAQGYIIENIEKMNYNSKSKDFDYNSCTGVGGKIKSIFFNFLRFQEIGKISKKYGYLFGIIYLILFCVVVLCAIIILK